MNKIEIFNYEGPGVETAYNGDGRILGIKNYSDSNDLSGSLRLERHLQTDEQFLLFQGHCIIITEGSGRNWVLTPMERAKVYNIPRGLWHTTVMSRDCRMVLVENSDTSTANSEYRQLSETQCETIRTLCQTKRIYCQ